ncbi:galactosylceramide sulfotransferase-like [Amphiura filiformis]|uniref:galactosylceramide sulfotransferase-like n=1 Tax=Amphiura filiformis TaxID=82378 RepID=UPI003B216B3F
MAIPGGKKGILFILCISLVFICVYLSNIPVGVVLKPSPWTQNTFRYITGHLTSSVSDGVSNNVSLRAIHSHSNHSMIQLTQPTLTQKTWEAFQQNHINQSGDPEDTEYPTNDEDALIDENDLYEDDNLLEGGLQVFFGNVSTYVDDLPVRTFVCDSFVKKIVFIKTHKTASTTVATIFERFGYQRELAFALPKNSHTFPSLRPFNRDFVASMNGFGKVNRDMLTNHARFNHQEMEAVVPGATFVTILREPVSQFESQFGYFEMAKSLHIIHVHNPLEQFFKYPRIYLHRNVHQWSQNKNGQIFDLGLDHEYQDSEGMVKTKIQDLGKNWTLF